MQNPRINTFRFMTIIALFCLLIAACATVEKTTYTTLTVSQTTYDTTLSALGDLYKQGKITDDQKQEIIDKAREYKTAHNLAVTAFLKYKQSGVAADEEDYLVTLSKATSLLAEFIELARPYIE